MVNFYRDVFLPLCVSAGKKPTNVAMELGLSRSVVSNWKTRGTLPTDVSLQKVADYFGVDIEELTGAKKEQPNETVKLSDVKQMLTDLIPQISDDTASMLLILAKQLTAQGQSKDSLR